MSARDTQIGGTADSLRRAFDRSFAEAVRDDLTRFEDLLAIRVGGDAFAFRISEIAGVFVDRKITTLPTPIPELVGIAGFRGAIVPVFDLGALLGYPLSPAPRWLVLVATGTVGTVVGLAFDEVGGTLRLGSEALAPNGGAGAKLRHVREMARTEEGARPIIHVPSVLEALEQRAHHHV